MICFDDFIQQDGIPIYQQILLYLKRGIVSGIIQNGDELPSRRMLSARLGVNPNTVQKAYRLLEDQSLIQSHTGAKSCMVLDAEKTIRIRHELLEADTRRIVRAMQQMGITKDEALALIETYWNNDEE